MRASFRIRRFDVMFDVGSAAAAATVTDAPAEMSEVLLQ
jgi:hypothetical protein